MTTKFWFEKLNGRNNLEELSVDGKTVRIDLREIGWEDVNWMHLAQERDQCLDVVNTVMNLLVP
jgi:hypothetical protein